MSTPTTTSLDLAPITHAFVTLLTRPSYLPGAVLLAHTLQKQQSAHPLLVLTTPSFPAHLLPPLRRELTRLHAHLIPTTPLSPPAHNTPPSLIATRFADTWTKLRIFSLHRLLPRLERLVFLDADMLVLQNIDCLFALALPRDSIAANHACVCNLDGDSWAPDDWNAQNCAYSALGKGDAPAEVPRMDPGEEGDAHGGKRTHTLLNSGMFVCTPFEEQWVAMLRFLENDERVKQFLFPDQDFLAEFFRGRWKSVGWEFNALKTMRYWHTNIWEDKKVKNLHYIVDKPWSRRVGKDGIAGYLGRDGETHGWWWEEFEAWETQRESEGDKEILKIVRSEVAKPLGIEGVAEELHGDWRAK